jgi:choline dehydrogenase-like flavoprotein/pimeloyl-ACP methyl ester carboxylesterase
MEKNKGITKRTSISKGFESLIGAFDDCDKRSCHYDVIVIGSGYGGSIAAKELSIDSNLSIALLERGKEFVAGAFPSAAAEIPTELRVSTAKSRKPVGRLEGLYDLRLGDDCTVLQANGLGGGSLINAGVMERAKAGVFADDRWPSSYREMFNSGDPEGDDANLEQFYQRAERELGAVRQTDLDTTKHGSYFDNSVSQHSQFGSADYVVPKYHALSKLEPDCREARLSINFTQDYKNSAGIALDACKLCGECALGCNFNAKNSLNENLLVSAYENGVDIFTGTTVLRVMQGKKISADQDDFWELETVFTDEVMRHRQKQSSYKIRARKIVIAAGSLGSTELLMKSRSNEFQVSPMLGNRFSSNGDMIFSAFYKDQNIKIKSLPSPAEKYALRNTGPTITGLIDRRTNDGFGVVIQDMSGPSPTTRLFKEMIATAKIFNDMTHLNIESYHSTSDFLDRASLNENAFESTAVYAAMGRDGAEGRLVLPESVHYSSISNIDEIHEGLVTVDWKSLRKNPLFDNQLNLIQKMHDSKGQKATVIPNPVWKMLPQRIAKLVNLKKGPPMTVHPLGGAVMGDNAYTGVVDEYGKLFKVSESNQEPSYHQGILILDGSIVPTAVGINPALTIAAISYRAIENIKKEWSGSPSRNNVTKKTRGLPAPITVRQLDGPSANAGINELGTEITITERLFGASSLESDTGEIKESVIQLTLFSEPVAIKDLVGYTKPGIEAKLARKAVIKICPKKSNFRIFYKQDWEAIRRQGLSDQYLEEALDDSAVFSTGLSENSNEISQISVLNRGSSNVCSRLWRTVVSYFWNRGLRDRKLSGGSLSMTDLMTYANAFTNAGVVRTIDYDIYLAEYAYKDSSAFIAKDFTYLNAKDSPFSLTTSRLLVGQKSIQYKRRANPWRQLSEVTLTNFPNRKNNSLNPIKLCLDTNFLARKEVALIQVAKQENQVSAIADVAALMTYLSRVILPIHLFSFRKPEPSSDHYIKRTAGPAPGLPNPIIHKLRVDKVPDHRCPDLPKGSDVSIMLTEYRQPISRKKPVIMIHGYSASSTTFAHHSLENSIARYFFEDQRDVWLLDLRTSCALPTSNYPWSFEEVADGDIETAIAFVVNRTKMAKVDIIAHCMGAVMLGMSILSKKQEGKTFFQDHVNRIIFSQATPTVVFTPENNFRAFLTRSLKPLLPEDYQFRSIGELTAGEDMLDRVLYTLPYPESEFDLSNPISLAESTSWLRTRHRMDALYGRTFELANVSANTLAHIDDFFGPINVETLTQVTQFAEHRTATNREGKNVYVSVAQLKSQWPYATLGIHSKNNGLIDYSTAYRTNKIFRDAGVDYESVVIEEQNIGHQDSLIGIDAHKHVFPHMAEFLNTRTEAKATEPYSSIPMFVPKDIRFNKGLGSDRWYFDAPKYGPVFTHTDNNEVRVMFGKNDAISVIPVPIFLPVVQRMGGYQLAGEDRCNLMAEYVEASSRLHVNNVTVVELDHDWIVMNITPSFFKNGNIAGAEGWLIILAYLDHQLMDYESSLERSDTRFVIQSLDVVREVSWNSSDVQGKSQQKKQRKVDDIKLTSELSGFLASRFNKVESLEFGLLTTRLFSNKESIKESGVSIKDKPFIFALGSCQYPSGVLDKEVAYESYKILGESFKDSPEEHVDMTLLVGDQVYVDATAGLMDPKDSFDRFTTPYLNLYSQKDARLVFRNTPIYTMLDDHELIDNWQPLNQGRIAESEKLFQSSLTPDNGRVKAGCQPDIISFIDELDNTKESGMRSFLKFQRGHWLGPSVKAVEENLWTSFKCFDFDFFMLDVRSQREARVAEDYSIRIANTPSPQIFSEDQFDGFTNWLKGRFDSNKPRFAISSSMLLPRTMPNHGSICSPESAIRVDGWNGYPGSLAKLLAYILNNEITNVVFLSGDEHVGCVAKVTLKLRNPENEGETKEAAFFSIHTPGLYTPMPFANGRPENYISTDNFFFDDGDINADGKYECIVETSFDYDTFEDLPVSLRKLDGAGEKQGFLVIETNTK